MAGVAAGNGLGWPAARAGGLGEVVPTEPVGHRNLLLSSRGIVWHSPLVVRPPRRPRPGCRCRQKLQPALQQALQQALGCLPPLPLELRGNWTGRYTPPEDLTAPVLCERHPVGIAAATSMSFEAHRCRSSSGLAWKVLEKGDGGWASPDNLFRRHHLGSQDTLPLLQEGPNIVSCSGTDSDIDTYIHESPCCQAASD